VIDIPRQLKSVAVVNRQLASAR